MKARHVKDKAVKCKAVAHDIPYQYEEQNMYYDDAFVYYVDFGNEVISLSDLINLIKKD